MTRSPSDARDLPNVPVHDYRDGGMVAFVRDHRAEALDLMDTVIRGLGPAGPLLRPFLSLGDRLARRHLAKMRDPYAQEIAEIGTILARPGPTVFNLSYEFGCTARVFDAPEGPILFRTLDWPFRGLGERIRIVHLLGSAGNWTLATWPGVVGCLQATAPGRFAVVLNQAPERGARLGRAVAWVSSKRAVLRSSGLPPAHLLRQVCEIAPDFDTAKRLLTETPLAAPVIYTLAGPRPGQACTIERTETQARQTEAPAAANHFASGLEPSARWRSRGYDSEARRDAVLGAEVPIPIDALEPPILNPLTRLAVSMDATGSLSVIGYDADRPVTALTHITCEA